MSDERVKFWVGGQLVDAHAKAEPTVNAESEALRADLDAVTAERDKLAAEVEDLRSQLETVTAEASDAVQDALLKPYAKGAGYYTFPATEEGGEEIKVRGQAKAWQHYQAHIAGA